MSNTHDKKISLLVKKLPDLTDSQIDWLIKVSDTFNLPHEYYLLDNSLLNKEGLEYFGDSLRVHHAFSNEPFSKDKFEYVLETVLNMSGIKSELSPKGNPGHDITINSIPVSLKTQADSGIRLNKIWISKFMELGKGNWGENPDDLIGLREFFFRHMKSYERIFTLRALEKGPRWKYELVEIPKKLLLEARNGRLEMKTDSKQFPKPGYCYVMSDSGEVIYKLYFDGGGERKLQIKDLLKKYCTVHATWTFDITPI